MKQKLRIGFIGCGQFCRAFVPLFQAHPAVEYVAVTDKFPERCRQYDEMFHVDRIFDSFEEMILSDDINAVAIFSQRNQHGWMAIEALKAGKHVYSAVPMATDIREILEIVRLVRETGLTYSMGETGIYRPAAIFCREKYASGEMGDMVYAEAQYNHDIKHLYHTFQYSEGDAWRKMAGLPPFYYPTHSTSMVLSAANAYAKKVSCFGYTDHMDPEIFGEGKNYWDNPFSNSSMLLQLSNGAVARISENRRIAWNTPPTYISNFHGTKASYECSIVQHSYITMPEKEVFFEDVSDLLNPIELTAHRGEPDFHQNVIRGKWSGGEAPIQKMDRLPEELKPLPTHHAGTHKFMVDDFCQAYWADCLSPTNAWAAARYNLPGLTAHQSAMEGGVLLDVPDPGETPAGTEVLSADRLTQKKNYNE